MEYMCFCMNVTEDEFFNDPEKAKLCGSGCGRCLERVRIGINQAKNGEGKPLSYDLNEDNEWLNADDDDSLWDDFQ